MKRSHYVRKKQHTDWYVHDIVGILFAVTALFMFLCLISYNPYDPTWFYATTDLSSITNWCGTIGAHVAVLLIYLCGASSLLGILSLLFCAYACIATKSYAMHSDRILAFYVLMCTSAAWCYTYQIDFLGSSFAGGIVGAYFYTTLYKLFDSVGALLCMYTLLLISVLLITRLSLVRCISYGVTLSKKAARWVLHTQPRIQALFITIGTICTRTNKYRRTWLQKIGSLFAHENSESAYQYTCYNNQGFDESLYDTAVWEFQEQPHQNSTIDPTLTTAPTGTAQQHTPIPNTACPPIQQDSTQSIPPTYTLPDIHIFTKKASEKTDQKQMRHLEAQAHLLEEKLARFGIGGSVTSIKQGPVVTLYEYQPSIDSKISKITALENDLALALQAMSIRIIAPIPGKSVVGFEVANKHMKEVLFSTIVHSRAYTKSTEKLPLILGQDTVGEDVVVDLSTMPHLLVAGSTGSGKSVALNSMLMSLLCACSPDELRLILIDPKRLEFAPYADIAHLIFPIITEPRKACQALAWVVKEMEKRYEIMAQVGAKNSYEYNKHSSHQTMPFMVVIIDELADLMMTAGKDVEFFITRIAQMARAAGIHIIVATQRPSVDVVTGLIKANFPSRISFRVASKVDSRTILDMPGADTLLGRGDMLFLDSRAAALRRIHGAYVSDQEIENVVAYIRSQKNVIYRDLMEEILPQELSHEPKDEIYDEVLLFLKGVDEISISLLQRKFRIGYNRSARIIDTLESAGLIMSSENGKIRKVIK